MSHPPKILESAVHPTGWLDEAVQIVAGGGVVALPYERLFGLAADATSADAIERICRIKRRRQEDGRMQPISVIIKSSDEISRVAEGLSGWASDLVGQYWPGPLTILLKGRSGLHPALLGPGGLVGVRVPGPSPAAELIAAFGGVLTATSANPSGAADALSHHDVTALKGVDGIVPGSVPGPPGSTVLDCSGEAPRIIRSGCVALEG